MEEEETSADYDTNNSDVDNEHASLFRNSFPVNSYSEFHSKDKVVWYLIINFLFLFYYSDNYFSGNAINFLVSIVYDTSYDRKSFTTFLK